MNTRGKRYHPVKPARSYKEQLARLTDIHGLTIEDEARARYILSTVNYYRLTTCAARTTRISFCPAYRWRRCTAYTGLT